MQSYSFLINELKVYFKDEKSAKAFLTKNLFIDCRGDILAISNCLCAVSRYVVYALRLKLIANDHGHSCHLYCGSLSFP